MMATTTPNAVRLMLILLVLGVGNAQLSPNFYSSSCPNLLTIIRNAVNTAVTADPRMGASLLRLHFHDCFVNAILLSDTANFTGEQTAAPNANSLRGFGVIDTIKTQVEQACPNIVSCADILAVAARDGTVALNGPSWALALGRRDSTTASLTAANNQIPAPGLNLPALITNFANKGFTANELVALSGSHTIGQARCATFRNRIYNDANINATYATTLRANCPRTGGNNNLSPLDVVSPVVFNNDYYGNLLTRRGLLHSDQELFNNASTDAQVRAYSTNSATFFNDFANAMIKMSNLSPLTGTNGQIRRVCSRTN
ncbi:hypothetical protein RD792_011039 [Penstemon davidsonii]|uniref:Peroxidase n=1 Tax=Penstemon davidsonii TaxID=160366 RepID=A0ABR0D3G0_9LAMI|nr:hypothetical protein RD792_011039 [Penstemon davidsonii]